MALTYLRDRNGFIIGKVEVLRNGDKMLMDRNGHILGKYLSKTNLTIDYYGHIVGRGDVLTMLLR